MYPYVLRVLSLILDLNFRNYRSKQTGWPSLFSGTHRGKILNRVFLLQQTYFLQKYYKFKCPSTATYEHINIKRLPIVFISSFFHFVRRSLENIFLLWSFCKHVFTITYIQHCLFVLLLTRARGVLMHSLPSAYPLLFYKCCFDLQNL